MGSERRTLRCAIYTRKSSEHGLEQDFNSLHAQRESAEAYIKSQAHEGWKLVRTSYDDGGLTDDTGGELLHLLTSAVGPLATQQLRRFRSEVRHLWTANSVLPEASLLL
jgi:hypothetical protein